MGHSKNYKIYKIFAKVFFDEVRTVLEKTDYLALLIVSAKFKTCYCNLFGIKTAVSHQNFRLIIVRVG